MKPQEAFYSKISTACRAVVLILTLMLWARTSVAEPLRLSLPPEVVERIAGARWREAEFVPLKNGGPDITAPFRPLLRRLSLVFTSARGRTGRSATGPLLKWTLVRF